MTKQNSVRADRLNKSPSHTSNQQCNLKLPATTSSLHEYDQFQDTKTNKVKRCSCEVCDDNSFNQMLACSVPQVHKNSDRHNDNLIIKKMRYDAILVSM